MTRSAQDCGMVDLPGGEFQMGSDRHYLEERPRHLSHIKPFGMDCTAVSNAQFAEFVEATGYRTHAEIPLDPAADPSMPAVYFEAGSLVFQMTDGPIDLRDFRQWWKFTPGACWHHPEGPASTIKDRLDHHRVGKLRSAAKKRHMGRNYQVAGDVAEQSLVRDSSYTHHARQVADGTGRA